MDVDVRVLTRSQIRFLIGYSILGNPGQALKAAGFSDRTYYLWRQDSALFKYLTQPAQLLECQRIFYEHVPFYVDTYKIRKELEEEYGKNNIQNKSKGCVLSPDRGCTHWRPESSTRVLEGVRELD